MAIKRKVATTEVAEMSIENVADLFQKFAIEKKEVEKKEKQYKEILIAYAETHAEKFEGKMLKFPNGVYVEQRERLKSSFDEDAITPEWIRDYVHHGGSETISVKFDDKKIANELKSETAIELLQSIDYEASYETTYAAYAK